MDTLTYQRELADLLNKAIDLAEKLEEFELYSLNVWTDVQAGASAISLDTYEHSQRAVAELKDYFSKQAAEAREQGDMEMASLMERPILRNDNPADFKFREFVEFEHPDWQATSRDWDDIEQVLRVMRDQAVITCRRQLPYHPDAEVSIGTRRDWYDLPVKIRSTEEENRHRRVSVFTRHPRGEILDVVELRHAFNDAKGRTLADELLAFCELLRHPGVTWADLLAGLDREGVIGDQAWLALRTLLISADSDHGRRSDRAYWESVLANRSLRADASCQPVP